MSIIRRGFYPFRSNFSLINRMWDDMLADPYYGFTPYWRNMDKYTVDVAKDVQVTNDDSKFCVNLDVSHFRPDELKVNLDGRVLTIEGNQEERTENTVSKRAFVRSWTLPDEVDLEQIESRISENGKLQIEAKKTAANEPKTKNIPIKPAENQ